MARQPRNKNFRALSFYGKLFDGITGNDKRGFGTALKEIAEEEGNVSWCFHMTSHLPVKGSVADSADPQGVLNFADPKRDSGAVAAFNWSYEWRNTGPRGGMTDAARTVVAAPLAMYAVPAKIMPEGAERRDRRMLRLVKIKLKW